MENLNVIGIVVVVVYSFVIGLVVICFINKNKKNIRKIKNLKDTISKQHEIIEEREKIISFIEKILSEQNFFKFFENSKIYLGNQPYLFSKLFTLKLVESLKSSNKFNEEQFVLFLETYKKNKLRDEANFNFIVYFFQDTDKPNISDEELCTRMHEVLLEDSGKYTGDKLMPVFFNLIGEERFSNVIKKFRYQSDEKGVTEQVMKELNEFKNYIQFDK